MLMGKNIEILSLFSDSGSQSSINQLVEKSFKIALTYLRYNQKRISKVFAAEELTVEEVAISAITPLFCKESEEQFIPIIREFNSWQPSITSKDETLFFLNTIITSRVEQHISRMLKEHDPFFSKILDSVSYLIKKDGYKRVNYLGRKYIVNACDSKVTGKTIDQEAFYNLPVRLFKNRKSIIADILSYLEHETEFAAAIPLNAFVIRLRNLNSNSFKLETSVNEIIASFDIAELVNIGFDTAVMKLKNSYFEKGKINNEELLGLKKTLRDIADDIGDGGINRGLFEYLIFHMPGMDRKEFKVKYHNILEYLYKVMKNTIRDQMAEGRE
jgi:hypothetical protein